MKKQNIAIIAICLGIALSARLSMAGNDCAVNGSMPHPSETCQHKTTSGSSKCDTKQSGQLCDGTQTTCSKIVFKRILEFPTVVDNNTDSKGCWTGHNYITNEQKKCVETDTCTWEGNPGGGGNCYQTNKNSGDGGTWSQEDYATSNTCN